MKKKWIPVMISIVIGLLLLTLGYTKLIANEPIFDTDRCLKMPNTHCEIVRYPNGTVNISIGSVINGTYYYNYT